MRRKLLVALLCLALAAGVTGTFVTASAGINISTPVEKVLDGAALSSTDFHAGNTDGVMNYTIGNSTYAITGASYATTRTGFFNPIPKADMVEGAKFTVQLDVLAVGTDWTQVFYFQPFTTEVCGVSFNPDKSLRWRQHASGTNFTEKTGWPADATIAVGDADPTTLQVETITTGAGWFDGNLIAAAKAAGKSYVTFWYEFDPTAGSITVYTGDAATGEKTKKSVASNCYTVAEADNYYMTFGFGDTFEFDNISLYRTMNGENKVYGKCDFEDPSKILPDGTGATAESYIMVISQGNGGIKTYDSSINFTNPTNDAYVTTRKAVIVDGTVETAFEMEVSYNITTLAAGREIGIALGLDDDRTLLSAPTDGASFVYLKKDEETIEIAVRNVAGDGTSTEIGEAHALTATLGDKITVKLEGKKNGDLIVTVEENSYTYQGVDFAGCLGFAHMGEGECTYMLYANEIKVTQYTFGENDSQEVVSNTFDADYYSESKFATQSKINSETFTVQDTTSHEANGLVADNGKLGFYGTGTNSRFMFKDQYADFVLQFDYISSPVSERVLPSSIETGGTYSRYSPLFILFGSESSIPEIKQTYALGLLDGNVTGYFWGAESIVSPDGKLQAAGATLAVLSGYTPASEDYEAPVPYYSAPGAHTPNMPSDPVKSLYNRTTRVKFVVLNNKIALFCAPVSEDGQVGEYYEAYSFTIPNTATGTYGYVGLGTDTPGWFEIDNLALTPISTETAVEAGVDCTLTADIVPDVDPADMATDREPTRLGQAEITVDAENKKITWNAVENAAEYVVTVRNADNETVATATIAADAALEYDLSALEAGEYTVAVVARPADAELYLESRSAVTYTAQGATPGTDTSDTGSGSASENPGTSDAEKIDCSGGIGAASVFGIALLGVAAILKKRS